MTWPDYSIPCGGGYQCGNLVAFHTCPRHYRHGMPWYEHREIGPTQREVVSGDVRLPPVGPYGWPPPEGDKG